MACVVVWCWWWCIIVLSGAVEKIKSSFGTCFCVYAWWYVVLSRFCRGSVAVCAVRTRGSAVLVLRVSVLRVFLNPSHVQVQLIAVDISLSQENMDLENKFETHTFGSRTVPCPISRDGKHGQGHVFDEAGFL